MSVFVNNTVAAPVPVSISSTVEVGDVTINNTVEDPVPVLVLSSELSPLFVTGTTAVTNFPASQVVSVSNLPSTQEVEVSNFPATQDVEVTNFPSSQSVVVSNFPSSQSVAVSNFPSVQPVSGSLSVAVTSMPSASSAQAHLLCGRSEGKDLTAGAFEKLLLMSNVPAGRYVVDFDATCEVNSGFKIFGLCGIIAVGAGGAAPTAFSAARTVTLVDGTYGSCTTIATGGYAGLDSLFLFTCHGQDGTTSIAPRQQALVTNVATDLYIAFQYERETVGYSIYYSIAVSAYV